MAGMKKVGCQLTPLVAQAINEELEYQEALPYGNRTDNKDYGVAGQLVTLKVYADKALAAWTDTAGDEKALDMIRKCAGIAVRALVMYGCPRRQYTPAQL